MRNRKEVWIFLFLLAVLSVVLVLAIFNSKNQELKVVFFDVGQGDAILVSQGSNQVLIDSGKSGQVILEKLGKYVPFWDRKIEAVILTHPDQDHIGGFADVFKSYQVETVLKTNAESESKTFEVLKEYISNEKSEVVEAKGGISLSFPNGSKMEIVYPSFSVSGKSDDTNSSSVVCLLENGQDKFIFTGDISGEKELSLIGSELVSNSRVLKVSHHGSKYSTTEDFLKKISPQDAIVSVGKNSYGHPSEETIGRLKSFGVRILRTDEEGDVVYLCPNLLEKCILQN